MATEAIYTKSLGGAEDLLLDASNSPTVIQTRAGKELEITKINSSTIPYSGKFGDPSMVSIKDQLDSSAYVIDTVEDFGTVPSGVTTVIVKDLNRGGTFIYEATQSAVNNSGTIFDGWVRQYSGAVNVKWFGAKGDGVTDDTVAIQNTLDNFKNITSDDSLFIVQYCSIPQGVIWIGNSTTIKQVTSDSWVPVHFNYSGYAMFDLAGSNITLSGITFKPKFEAIMANAQENIDISNCIFDGESNTLSLASPIHITNCITVDITDNLITGCGSAGSWSGTVTSTGYGDGILILGGSNTKILGNTILSSGRQGISLFETKDYAVSNNIIKYSYQSGIQIFPNTNTVVSGIVSSNIIAYNCADGIDVNWINSGIADIDLIVTNNRFEKNGYFLGDINKKGIDGSGIGTYRSVKNFVVSNNTCVDARGAACYMTNVTNAVVTGNTIVQINDGGKEGIFLADNINNCSISNNIINGNSRFAFSVSNVSTLNNVTVSGNTFTSLGIVANFGSEATYNSLSFIANTLNSGATIHLSSKNIKFNNNSLLSTASPAVRLYDNQNSFRGNKIVGTGSLVYALNINNLNIVDNDLAVSSGTGIAIDLNGCDNCYITGNSLNTDTGNCIRLYSNGSNVSNYTTISHNTLNASGVGAVAILTNYCDYIYLNKNTIVAGTTSYLGTGSQQPVNAVYS